MKRNRIIKILAVCLLFVCMCLNPFQFFANIDDEPGGYIGESIWQGTIDDEYILWDDDFLLWDSYGDGFEDYNDDGFLLKDSFLLEDNFLSNAYSMPMRASADIKDSGTFGLYGVWTFYENGLLTIDATQSMDMPDFNTLSSRPWDIFADDIIEIIIGTNITSIGFQAFYGCTSLEKITIPDSVTRIDGWAFISCNSLINIEIPDSVTSIGERAFSYCTSLISIDIPNSLTIISSDAFYSCISLESITIPYGVRIIGNNAFSSCTSLKNITLPESLGFIGMGAFSNCTSLESITIPDRWEVYIKALLRDAHRLKK